MNGGGSLGTGHKNIKRRILINLELFIFDQKKSHKKKIFMAKQDEKEVVRSGMDFVAQGRT